MAIKFKDFLQVWLAANHDVKNLDTYIYNYTYDDDEEFYKMKNSLRNYLLFGDYYVTSIENDCKYDNYSMEPFASVIISKKKPDPIQNCPFAYED